MNARSLLYSTFVAAIVGGGVASLHAQLPRPLAPVPAAGNRVVPFFDGWTRNPDGSVALSFGYSSLNTTTIDIPLGPDNFITPKEFDGRQPTSFPRVVFVPPVGVQAPGGASDSGGPPLSFGLYGVARERGTFTVTVPKDYQGDIVWTLRYRGQTWTVPGRTKTTAYELSWPMAMGSVPPLVRFAPGGPAGRSHSGIQGPTLQAKVGVPLELEVWIEDDGVHEKEPIPVKRDLVPAMTATWFKHAGPVGADVRFASDKLPLPDVKGGRVSTAAVFTEPGDYTVRVRADTFGNIDSTPDDQCCWTNAYWKVQVSR